VRSDGGFLGLTDAGAPGCFSFEVVDHLARLDGLLYGGTAIAVSIAAAEALTARDPLWMTTQFVSTVGVGDRVSVRAEVLAAGQRTSQVRVTATTAQGGVVFASLGATGIHRPGGLAGAFETCPRVQPPEESVRWSSPLAGLARAAGFDPDTIPVIRRGFSSVVEVAEPVVFEHPDPGPGRICLWVRRNDTAAVTPAVVAYLADVVPMGVAHALGVVAGGTSLDNTIRIGPFVHTNWILLDLRPHLAVGGYGHGIAHAWSERGDLLATASQTAAMREVDLSQITALAQRQADS
jgi:acyl-CoA thioesterase